GFRTAFRSAARVPALPDAGVRHRQRTGASSLLLVGEMMARITVVTGGQLSTCPRMLKTADTLHQEGYRVRVVSVRHTPWATAADLVVRSTRTWRCDVVDYGRSTAPWRRVSTGIRWRGAGLVARGLGPTRV